MAMIIKTFFSLKRVFILVIAILLAFTFGCARKGPYLIYSENNTNVKIVWQLMVSFAQPEETCKIEWGTDDTYGHIAEVTENGSGPDEHIYSYTITGLTPGTNYKYRIFMANGTKTENGKVVSLHQQDAFYEASFNTPPADSATSLKFFAYGDVRGNFLNNYSIDAHEAVATAMVNYFREVDPGFQTVTIVSGDLNFLGGDETHWDAQLFNPQNYNSQQNYAKALLANTFFISAMGNHDTYSGGTTLFVKYFDYPYVTANPAVDGTYWSFDYGPAHFAMVDQYVAYDAASAQFSWLAEDLAGSTKNWNFIVFHEPAYSAGGHEGKTSVKNLIDDLFADNPAIDIDMVIAGHNHHYLRAVDSHGLQHIVAGGGGAELKPLWDPQTNPWDTEVVVAKECHCYSRIELEDTTLSLTTVAVVPDSVYDYDISEINGRNCMFADPEDGKDTICDGDIIDTLTISPAQE